MKTLVIHPSDYTTDFLKPIYSDIDATVVNDRIGKGKLRRLIIDHERIIMMGHGCERGLFDAKYNTVIDSNLVQFLRKKECVFIWCNANVFVEKYKLIGFYTGMIVSESMEANLYCLDYAHEPIEASNIKFAECLKESIILSGDGMYRHMKENYNIEKNEIVDFNKQNIHYSNGEFE